MARKSKAKRRGRPALAKGTRREVYSVRLPGVLVDRAEAHGGLTAIVEKALTEWLDQQEVDRIVISVTEQPSNQSWNTKS